jgi:hypothetical protein
MKMCFRSRLRFRDVRKKKKRDEEADEKDERERKALAAEAEMRPPLAIQSHATGADQ